MARAFTLLVLGEGIHAAEIQALMVKQGAAVQEGNAVLVGQMERATVQVRSPYSCARLWLRSWCLMLTDAALTTPRQCRGSSRQNTRSCRRGGG